MSEESTYTTHFITRQKFKFKTEHSGAEQLEHRRNVQQLLPFLRDEECWKNECTEWLFQRGLAASPGI